MMTEGILKPRFEVLMEKSGKKLTFSKIPWIIIAIVLLTAMAAIITVVQQTQSGQSLDPNISGVEFQGEYRIDGGEWQQLSSGNHISATRGNVELKGVFLLYEPTTGEKLGPVESGTVLHLYLDHLKATVKDAEGNVWSSDNETPQLGKGACAEAWTTYEYIGSQGGEVAVTLYNPHVFGNERSVDSFLNNLRVYSEKNRDLNLQLFVGLLLAVFLVVLLFIALVSSVFRVKYHREIWLFLLLVFFGGLHFVFSSDRISLWNNLHVVNTAISGFSMMFYLLTAAVIAASFLRGGLKKVANAVSLLLGAATVAVMIASIDQSVKLYDLYPYWMPVAVGVAATLSACIIIGMINGRTENEGAIKTEKKYVYIPSLAVLLSFIIDAAATFFGIWQGGALSVPMLLLVLFAATVVTLSVVPKSIRTVLVAKEIEAEKQIMEMKLQESHISIMLSQIQPHFLYNTLNSIYQLCETNPMLARSMVNSFSEYLRNNLSSLDEPGLISFETELSHIKTYLEIEKIRFDDTLDIQYDVKCVDFMLPVLTVQPIVENAVKHGTSKKRGGGKVIISTAEDNESYVITVTDTGCGFDLSKIPNDGKRHIGIENVRQRLANMCDGVLTIESEIGVGTVATIRIPKGEKQ